MRSRVLTALVLLAGVAGAVGHAQPPTPPRPGPAPVYDPPRPTPYSWAPAPAQQDLEHAPLAWPVGAQAARPASPVVAPGDLPLDTLVAELKGIQAQKAALAKREADVAKEVRRRLAEYTEALDKLDPAPAPKIAPSINPPDINNPPLYQPSGGTRGRATGRIPSGPEYGAPSPAPAQFRKPGAAPAPEPTPDQAPPLSGIRRGTTGEPTPLSQQPEPAPPPSPDRQSK